MSSLQPTGTPPTPGPEIEQAQQELEIASGGAYNTPEDITIRNEFLKLGHKSEMKCLSVGPISPDMVTSCECVKAGGKTAAICTMKDGFKCFKNLPFSSKWTEEVKERLGIPGCQPDWPTEALAETPAAAALVDNNNNNLSLGELAIMAGALVLLLAALGYLKL